MINGAHTIIYSRNADADRRFLSDVLGLPSVDAGGGFLIFGLPPAEVAMHPSTSNDVHELYLTCDDVHALIAKLEQRGVPTSPVRNEGWGLVTQATLPGGGKLGIYQPRHARPPTPRAGKSAPKKKPAKAAAKKAATKSSKKKAPAKKAAKAKAKKK
jgi:hypothetical protein